DFIVGMIYFDSNMCVGKQGLKHPMELWKTEDVLSVMEQCAVSAALVYSGWSKDYAPRYGNERLMKELQKNDRLYGCYTILPNLYGDFFDPDEMVRDIKEKGFVATKMFPGSHKFTPDERTMGYYYSALEKENIPLLVDSSEIGFSYAEHILERHPDLKLLLLGVGWGEERKIFPLLREYQNLYLDFSLLQTNYVIERMLQNYGADRFVFGSGMPKMSLGAARSLIDYAQISQGDKQKIAGGNLARLCGLPIPKLQKMKNDDIAKGAAEGKPISAFVFDSHTHILEEGGHCGGGYAMPNGDLEHMDALFTRMGVDQYCVAPWLGIWTDSEAGNEVMLDMVHKKPEKAVGYVLIDPNYVDDIELEASKYHLDHKVPGIKMFYGRTHVRYNDPVFDPWWKIANGNSLFALLDYGSYPGYLQDVEELALRYPNVSFFLDHAGRDFNGAISNARY
ncbi:MAG TPA: hypothetical protein DDZ89_04915, partial [Clostridiales bacterium]|nr:hypothetical protein [Clostridiales bacterium]